MSGLDVTVTVVLVGAAVALWMLARGRSWTAGVAALALIGAAYPLARSLTGPIRDGVGWVADLAVAIVGGFGASGEWLRVVREAVTAAPWIGGIVLLVVVLVGVWPWSKGAVSWRVAWAAALIPTLVLLAPPGLAKTGGTITEAVAHASRQVGTSVVTFKPGK